MKDQIGTVLHCSNKKEPKQAKSKDEVIRMKFGTWIGFTFQLLLLHPQTHPGTGK